jgi:small subunit ribosomal protein S8
MSCTFPLGLLVSHTNNALKVGKKTVSVPFSNLNTNVCEVLKKYGFIDGFEIIEKSAGIKNITIQLRYSQSKSAIQNIKLESTPGKRIYSGYKNITPYFNKLGIRIISTSSGLVADVEARDKKLGGEVLLSVF